MANLIESIREWVKLDNEISHLRKEANERKKKQKNLSTVIMDQMKKNEIDEYNIKDGKIKYVKRNVKQSITKKYLISVLTNYYKGNIEQAEQVNNYIMDSREERTVEKLQLNH
jgi:hypothetical protein